MTSVVRSFAIASVMLMLAGVHGASAQIISPVEFTTTFPFAVGNTTVPAGSYTITPDIDNPSILELTGKGMSVFFQVDATQAPDRSPKTEVVFKRYGNGYVLKDIWMEGDRAGAETLTLEAENHLSKRSGKATEHRVAALKKPSATTASATSGKR